MKGRTGEALVLGLTNIELNKMIMAVLDYTTGEVIIKKVPKELEELDGDDLLTNMGFDSSNTEYMVVEGSLPVHVDTSDCTGIITLN